MKNFLTLLTVYLITSQVWTLPLKFHSHRTIDQSFYDGNKLAESVSLKLASPFVLVASSLNKVAGTIPNTLAATGAFLGSLISTPVQVTSTLVSGLASGLTGLIVGIPFAFGSGVKALASGDYIQNHETLQIDLNRDNLNDLILINQTHVIFINQNSLNDRSLNKRSLSQALFKPVAILIGIKGAVDGMSSLLIGQGFRAIGNAISSFGNTLILNGKEIKGAGSALYTWGTGGHTIPMLSSSDDVFSAINLTKKLPDSVNKYLIKLIMPVFIETISKDNFDESSKENEEIKDFDSYIEEDANELLPDKSKFKKFVGNPNKIH